MEDDIKLITLKEAAEISGYSADYIGQLIRAGKISGKQVYTNITWMTTAEAVLEYQKKLKAGNENKNTLKDVIGDKRRLLTMEFNIIKLFFQTFKFALPILIVIILCFLILSTYIIYFLTNNNINNTKTNLTPPINSY